MKGLTLRNSLPDVCVRKLMFISMFDKGVFLWIDLTKDKSFEVQHGRISRFASLSCFLSLCQNLSEYETLTIKANKNEVQPRQCYILLCCLEDIFVSRASH